jgi:cytochrome b
MSKVKVYDLPTRAFHLLFAVLFVTSFFIGKFIDDDSALYAYHMLSGLTMVFMVILRIVWGIIGSKYAKFSSFKLNPKDLAWYFQSILSGKSKRELGHNSSVKLCRHYHVSFNFCFSRDRSFDG